MPVPAAVPPWKPRIEFTSTTEGSTAAAIAAAVRALGGEAAACGEGAAALGDGATWGTTTGAEGDGAAALGAKLAGGAGEGGVDVATGRCGNPPTTAYDSASTRTTTASTMATTRKAAPVRRGGLGCGTPGGRQGPPEYDPE
jgi:hypothetical protein